MKHDLNDTIAAVATSTGEAGIGIVRLSGGKALAIADRIFVSKRKVLPSACRGYSLHYGWIMNEGRQVDEVLLSVMRKPASYTREDVVEINCHGGLAAQRAVLDAVLDAGARLAGPGEFTKRAFLNGRIDLAQAEAVLGIIKAKTDTAATIAVHQLKGSLSRQINAVAVLSAKSLAKLEAAIEFPDEELPQADLRQVRASLQKAGSMLSGIIEEARRGKIFRDGVTVVICGRANVGKSSLMNAILKRERSIVTPIAGTTRDIIEESVDIKGVPVRIVDTAGLLKPRDQVEEQAVARTKRSIKDAQVLLAMFDASSRLTAEDRKLLRRMRGLARGRAAIAVLNKIDRPVRLERSVIGGIFTHIVEISAKKGRNIASLEEEIFRIIMKGRLQAQEPVFVSSGRQIQELCAGRRLLSSAVSSLDESAGLEFVAQDLRDAIAILDELLGKRFSQDILDRVFSNFCIGK